jgi:hypothetical protein
MRRSQQLGNTALVDQTSLGLRSLVKQDGSLELSLAQVTVSPPKNDEVIVRVEATPINPSDLGLLLAGGEQRRHREKAGRRSSRRRSHPR